MAEEGVLQKNRTLGRDFCFLLAHVHACGGQRPPHLSSCRSRLSFVRQGLSLTWNSPKQARLASQGTPGNCRLCFPCTKISSVRHMPSLWVWRPHLGPCPRCNALPVTKPTFPALGQILKSLLSATVTVWDKKAKMHTLKQPTQLCQPRQTVSPSAFKTIQTAGGGGACL